MGPDECISYLVNVQHLNFFVEPNKGHIQQNHLPDAHFQIHFQKSKHSDLYIGCKVAQWNGITSSAREVCPKHGDALAEER